MTRYSPNHLTVQWHITERCNLRCRHCYQDSYTHKGFDLITLKSIADQVFALHARWEQYGSKVPLTFTVTGGEPCAHPDFEELLHILSAHRVEPALGILSNGSLINARLAQVFAQLKVSYVQLSVEGSPATHNAIRGPNHFQDVINATEALTSAGVRVVWSFTAHRDNFKEFAQVAQLAQQYKVNRVWSDRMIPACPEGAPLALDTQQTAQYLHIMQKAQCEVLKQRHNKTEVAMSRALQFQAGGGYPYRCTAGNELITIMPDGELYPCRRLPVSVGNVLHTPLNQLYDAPLLQQLRNFEAPTACAPCMYKRLCKGGLRCLAHAVRGDMFSPDPGCSALQHF